MKKILIVLTTLSVIALTGCSKKTGATTKKTSTTTKKQNTTTVGHMHNYVHYDEVPATCTSSGLKEHYECACGKKFNTDLVETTYLSINKLEHKLMWHDPVLATKVNFGTVGHYECSLCHQLFDSKKEALDDTITEKLTGYTVVSENKISMGMYPQTDVTEEYGESLTENFVKGLPTAEDFNGWTSYNYYAEGEINHYMFYIDVDIDYDGLYDFRGVYYTRHRTSSATAKFDDSNIFVTPTPRAHYDTKNTIYWFQYDPIIWNVISTDENNNAFLLADIILDAQPFYLYQDNREIDGETIYANNYEYSTIRSWLNTTFYETAFNSYQQELINVTLVDNSKTQAYEYDSDKYVCNNTNDKIFLMSGKEIRPIDVSIRKATYSDYSLCQQLYDNAGYSNNDGCTDWYLRTPYKNITSDTAYLVNGIRFDGSYYLNVNTYSSSTGVRPSCVIKLN